MAIALRYAALSDVGLVRSNNQDSGYAGPRLLVIADGMGGHAGGDVASSLAIGEMAFLDDDSYGPDAVLSNLSLAMHNAHQELLDRVAEEPALSGMGTTVTALLRTGGRLALAHIGDSRAYVLRDGQLAQITRDHTFVQRLVDDGRITPEEAEQHPQRSVLMRVLSDVVDDVEPDMSVREARIGDRYLLCSDGLSSVVSHDTLEQTMAAGADPDATCEQLVQLALRSGAPDNVTCIVADVVDTSASSTETVPIIVGAASVRPQPRSTPGGSPAERAAQLTSGQGVVGHSGNGVAGAPSDPSANAEDGAPEDEEPSPGRRLRRLRLGLGVTVVILVLLLGGFGAYRWSQGQFYVGDSAGFVAIYKGLPQDLGPISLSRPLSKTGTAVDDLPDYHVRQLSEGIVVDNQRAADSLVTQLTSEAQACRAARLAQASPSPSPSPAKTPAKAAAKGAATSKATPSASPSATPTGTPGSGLGQSAEGCQGLP